MQVPFQIEVETKSILGIMHIPNIQKQIPVIAVMCYGLNGNRVIQHRMSVKLGEFFEENGVNLIRFDYRNLGVSDGCFEKSNMTDRIKDIEEVCNYIKACFRNISTHMFLIGFSDGARNAILATESLPDLKGLILWNPIFNISSDNNKKSKNNSISNSKKFIIHPLYRIPMQTLLGVGMNRDLIKQLEQENAIELLVNYSKNILYIFGDNDELTYNIKKWLHENGILTKENSCLNVIEGADHLFSRSILKKRSWKIQSNGLIIYCKMEEKSEKNKYS